MSASQISSGSRAILVTGATGKQGGATVRALVESQPSPPFIILAVTRNPNSNAAKKLAALPNVHLVEGDFNDCEALFLKAKAISPIWAVFGVTVITHDGKVGPEVKQGTTLIDTAVTYGVKHFVLASADRGGPASDTNKTDVSFLASKYELEQHLKEKAAGAGMTWTILRSTGFMDNYAGGFLTKTIGSMWKVQKRPMQLISARDIGGFAALSFLNSTSKDYRNKAYTLVSDSLTFEEANRIFKEVVGTNFPTTFSFVGTIVKDYVVKDFGKMMKMLDNKGYQHGDIEELRRLKPDLMDFKRWLREESVWSTQAK